MFIVSPKKIWCNNQLAKLSQFDIDRDVDTMRQVYQKVETMYDLLIPPLCALDFVLSLT